MRKNNRKEYKKTIQMFFIVHTIHQAAVNKSQGHLNGQNGSLHVIRRTDGRSAFFLAEKGEKE